MGNNPGCKIDLRKISFTEKILTTQSKNIEIELPTRAERDELDKQGIEDFWINGISINEPRPAGR
jgi:hypothetical protein